MQKGKYITTTLPYANSKPHIGHAFEFIIADAIVRFFKFSGYGNEINSDVFFNIGLDEHGLKIQEAAEKQGISPQEYVDNLEEVWIDFLEQLQIRSYDSFYRTSDKEHGLKVQHFWKEALERGDIYKKKYKGKYCVGCESFKSNRELEEKSVFGVDPALDDPEVQSNKILICPDHPTTPLQEVEEENYFFKLSKYKNKLSVWAYKSVDFIEPKSKRAEFLKFIDSIEDISISRDSKKVKWGVPVPEDSTQTIYVWFDALLNYLFAVGYKSDIPAAFDVIWNDCDVIQICGPDNIKFQSVIFQGLLESAGIKHTDKLLVHGTILDSNGRKMSKTLGNVVDPIDQAGKYGISAVRYYALAGITTYGNSGWDESRLVELHNSHLSDDFGNLIARVSHLAGKILEENSNNPNIKLDYSYLDGDRFKAFFDIEVESIERRWEKYKVSEALQETNLLVKSLNKKINDDKPWSKGAEGWISILELHYALTKINDLYYPVFPHKSGKIRKSLKDCKKAIIFPKLELKQEV